MARVALCASAGSVKMCSDHADLQEMFRRRVSITGFATESLWNQRCSAYNLQALLDESSKRALRELQQRFAPWLSRLFVIPEEAMHISLIWLLNVRTEYPRPKHEIWCGRRDEWLSTIAKVAERMPPLRLAFTQMVITESAILAVAQPADLVNELRRSLVAELDLPSETKNVADLVHCTLFRFSSADLSFEALTDAAGHARIHIPFRIREIAVTEERRFPSLDSEVIQRIPLGEGIADRGVD